MQYGDVSAVWASGSGVEARRLLIENTNSQYMSLCVQWTSRCLAVLNTRMDSMLRDPVKSVWL